MHAWNVGEMDDELSAALNAVYDELAPGQARPLDLGTAATRVPRRSASELAFVATGAFDEPEHRDVRLGAPLHDRRVARPSSRPTATTRSWHPTERARLLAAVGVVLDARGGGFTMRYTCEVTRFARR